MQERHYARQCLYAVSEKRGPLCMSFDSRHIAGAHQEAHALLHCSDTACSR